jgi:hypothetical protein
MKVRALYYRHILFDIFTRLCYLFLQGWDLISYQEEIADDQNPRRRSLAIWPSRISGRQGR